MTDLTLTPYPDGGRGCVRALHRRTVSDGTLPPKRAHRWRIATATAALIALAPVPVVAIGRVLTPAATVALQKALRSVEPCRIDDLRVGGSEAVVRLCPRAPAQSCFSVRLTDPEAGCAGEEIGPWCLHWLTGEPPDAIRDSVRQALRASEAVWSRPHAAWRPEESQPGEADDRGGRRTRLRPLALAVLLLAAPALAGIGLGRTLGRWRWLVVVLVAALALMLVASLQQVGAWDAVAVGALFIGGLLLSAIRVGRRDALLLVVALAIALALLEGVVRWWLPRPPRFPPAEEAALVLEPAAWDAGCAVLYGPAGVDNEIQRLRRGPRTELRKRGPLVVHLGDSMTFGDGVQESEAFPALLDASQTDVVHANYGVWAVGTDFEYLLLQEILAAHRVLMVVLHVYVGNDVFEIDRPYACCDAGPLLDYTPDGPTARCASARWRFPIASRLGRSPPPYPLRVATGWSYAARHAAAAFSRLVAPLDLPPHFIRTEGEAAEVGWAHFTQIVATMREDLRARDITLIVNLLPNRQALESADPTAWPSFRTRRRVAAITTRLGIETLDAWDVFADAVKRPGAPRYFREQPDIHFAPEGHRLLARWLATHLPPTPTR